MKQIESLSKQNQMLFDENIGLQDRLLEMNSALHSSNASIELSHKEAAKQLPILKTNTTHRQGTKPDEDSDDYEQLRENQAQGIILEISNLLMKRFDVLK